MKKACTCAKTSFHDKSNVKSSQINGSSFPEVRRHLTSNHVKTLNHGRSSFSVINNVQVGNVGIFVQLLMEINYKQLPVANLHLSWCFESNLKCMIMVSELIFKFQQYRKTNIPNFVYFEKTRIKT